MNERERFEEWADKQGWVIQRHLVSGRYTVSFIQRQWQAWQARADLAAEREVKQPGVDVVIGMVTEYNRAYWATGSSGKAMRSAIDVWIKALATHESHKGGGS